MHSVIKGIEIYIVTSCKVVMFCIFLELPGISLVLYGISM